MKKTILVMLMMFAIIMTMAPVTSGSSQSTITYYDGQWMTGWLHGGITTYDAPALGAAYVDPGPYPYEFNLSEPLHVHLQIQHWLGKPNPSEENYLTIYLDGVPVLEADTIGLAWYPGGNGIDLIDLGTLPAGTHFINMSATFGNYYAMEWFKVLESVYDVAVINVVPANTQVYPTWMTPLNIAVTVLNNGTETANFNVTAYYENVTAAYEIGTLPVTGLAPDNERNVTFSWTLTDVALGLYNIKAVANLTGDSNSTNDEYIVYDAVKVKMPGDWDGTGEVDWRDLRAVILGYGGEPGFGNWDKQADFDGTDEVDWRDLRTVILNYGKETGAY